MERVPLRLPTDVKQLVDEARCDVGLNTYLIRAIKERLVKDGYLDAQEAAEPIRTGRRQRATAHGWARER